MAAVGGILYATGAYKCTLVGALDESLTWTLTTDGRVQWSIPATVFCERLTIRLGMVSVQDLTSHLHTDFVLLGDRRSQRTGGTRCGRKKIWSALISTTSHRPDVKNISHASGPAINAVKFREGSLDLPGQMIIF